MEIEHFSIKKTGYAFGSGVGVGFMIEEIHKKMHVETRSLVGYISCDRGDPLAFPFDESGKNLFHRDVLGMETGAEPTEKTVGSFIFQGMIYLRRFPVAVKMNRDRAYPFPIAIMTQIEGYISSGSHGLINFLYPLDFHMSADKFP